MPRQSPIQTNFTAGEISPRLLARSDLAKYRNGVKAMVNFKALPHGGAQKLAGTKHVASIKTQAKKARLIPFKFSVEQAYALEFGEQSIRAYLNNGQLLDGNRVPDPQFDEGPSLTTENVNGGSVTWAPGYIELSSGTAGGHFAEIGYAVALPYASRLMEWGLTFPGTTQNVDIKVGTTPGASDLGSKTQSADGDDFIAFVPTTLRVYVTIRIAFSASTRTVRVNYLNLIDNILGTPAWELPSPYLEADLPAVKFAQSADVLYLVHPSYPPYKVLRYGPTEWDIVKVPFIDGPYLDDNLDATVTITPSATTGTVTLTASKSLFRAGHVGALWRLTHGATTGYVEITGFTDTKTVTAEVKATLGATTATSEWAEGAWSSLRGYPAAITFYEQRLWFGRTAFLPSHLWGSGGLGDYENMTPGINDDDPVIYEIADGNNQVNTINWLTAARFMLVGTDDGEHRVGQEDASITPTNIQVRIQSAHGVADYQPAQIGDVTVFAQRARRKMRELTPTFDQSGALVYSAIDLSILAEHITRPGITHLAYQQEPDSIVWSIRDDGVLLGMTYERPQEVIGWHRHTTDGVYESVAVIPTATHDQVWVIVRRTIDGAARRFVEYFVPEYEDGDDPADAIYTHSTLSYSGASTTLISGLDHLEAKSVAITVGGAVHPQKVVSGGQITLDYASDGKVVNVGLPYKGTITTLPPGVNTTTGTAQSKLKRWADVWTLIYNTIGLIVNGKEVPFRSPGDLMDEPVPLFTGWVKVENLGYNRDGSITYEHDLPVPCTILAQTGTLDVDD